MSNPILKAAAGVAALAAIAFGASAIAGASGSGSGSANRMPGIPGGRAPNGSIAGPRGFARPVTGATAAKVTAAALARYPGQVEGVVALPTGDYVAHVLRSSGSEVHVLVNSRFEVTGLAPPPPGAPGGGAPPQPGSSSS